jgi:hypothetical protein
LGDDRFDYFTKVVSFERMDMVLVGYDFKQIGDALVALITFLYVDFLDTTGKSQHTHIILYHGL